MEGRRGHNSLDKYPNYKFCFSNELTLPFFTFIKCLETFFFYLYCSKIYIVIFTLDPQESLKPWMICKVAVLKSLALLSLPRCRLND